MPRGHERRGEVASLQLHGWSERARERHASMAAMRVAGEVTREQPPAGAGTVSQGWASLTSGEHAAVSKKPPEVVRGALRDAHRPTHQWTLSATQHRSTASKLPAHHAPPISPHGDGSALYCSCSLPCAHPTRPRTTRSRTAVLLQRAIVSAFGRRIYSWHFMGGDDFAEWFAAAGSGAAIQTFFRTATQPPHRTATRTLRPFECLRLDGHSLRLLRRRFSSD